MSAPKLALLAGLVIAALLAALWWQHDAAATRVRSGSVPFDAARTTVTTIESPRLPGASAATAAVAARPQTEPTGIRADEAELRAQAAALSYARVGGPLVDHLVTRGLARADGELVVRRFFEDNVRCLFDALRVEADAQSVAHDSLLDALEAELYDADGPLLGALIDLRAVENRVLPCALGAAQQAGIEPSALTETTRAAIVRRAR